MKQVRHKLAVRPYHGREDARFDLVPRCVHHVPPRRLINMLWVAKQKLFYVFLEDRPEMLNAIELAAVGRHVEGDEVLCDVLLGAGLHVGTCVVNDQVGSPTPRHYLRDDKLEELDEVRRVGALVAEHHHGLFEARADRTKYSNALVPGLVERHVDWTIHGLPAAALLHPNVD